MEIVILRHGKPKIETPGKVTASDFRLWIAAYNKAGIDGTNAPSPSAIAMAKACSAVVCSNLPRSIESAKALGVRNIEVQDALFRECEMPYADWSYPKLSVRGWSFAFRVLQMLGYSSNAESFKDARKRANLCALRLSELAKKHGFVLFVGHGSLNWLISKKLLRMGWVSQKSAGRGYWDYGIYRYNAT
jgi:broad specificity phosphatase PhoE